MITLTPAERHLSTAYGTVSLGGSASERTPTKTRPVRSYLFSKLKLNPRGNLSLGKWHFANPRTLSPFLPNYSLASMNFFYQLASFGTALPPKSIYEHLSQILSGAPFMNRQ